MKKFENTVVTIFFGMGMLIPMLIGAWEMFYNILDMYYDQALWCFLIYGVTVTYWIAKKMIIRIIRVNKK